MKIKGVIFDMDGLMFDTEKLLTCFWIKAAEKYGYEMKREHVLGIRSLAAKFAEPKLKKIFGDDFDYRSIRAERINLMNDYIEKNSVEKKKGLDELLDYLKGKYRIAVATATDYYRTEMYLKKAEVFDFFDKIICGPMVENGKPEPDIYFMACKKLKLKPEECIALEDSPNGILSAFRAGCHPVMIPDLSEPDENTRKMLYAELKDLSEVIGILKH